MLIPLEKIAIERKLHILETHIPLNLMDSLHISDEQVGNKIIFSI